MASNINTAIPAEGAPAVKSAFRQNFTVAKNEIEALQADIVTLEGEIDAIEVGAGISVVGVKTSTYQAGKNQLIPLDASGGPFTVTMPLDADLVEGDRVQFADPEGTVVENAVSVARNGGLFGNANTGQTVADDVLLSSNFQFVSFRYRKADLSWWAEVTTSFSAAEPALPSTVVPVALSSSRDATTADAGPDRVVVNDTVSAFTLTLQAFATAEIPVNSIINLARLGSGGLSVAAGAGVTLTHETGYSPSLRNPKTAATLLHYPLNTWTMTGALSEA